MAEETPLEPIEPEPVTVPTEPVAMQADPTEPVPTANPIDPATGSAQGPPPWPAQTAPPAGAPPAGAPPAGPPPASSSTVAVPKWVVAVVGVFLIVAIGFGVGFAVGYAVAPGDDSSDRAAVPPNGGFFPGPNGNGNNGDGNNGNNGNGNDGNNDDGDTPTIPRADSAFLGVATEASTDPEGVRIVRVVEGAPADEAKLETDDVITEVDGDAVTTPEELATSIGDHERGDEVTITYVRDGDTDTTRATLAARSSLEIPTPSTTSPGF